MQCALHLCCCDYQDGQTVLVSVLSFNCVSSKGCVSLFCENIRLLQVRRCAFSFELETICLSRFREKNANISTMMTTAEFVYGATAINVL
mmetsp:Transcript_14108/g.19758  ORF Transcript_14108/g.19758 Transcript_14108/m.19758 type:complete len:90 (-) Transcript_14108:136-405(-)